MSMSLLWRVVSQSFSKTNVISSNWASLSFIKMPYYAVARGRTSGIFMNWPDCEAQVKGFPGARYKKFDSVVGAQDFINTEGGAGVTSKSKQTYHQKPSTSATNNLKRSYSTYNNSNASSKPAPPKQVSKQYQNDDDILTDDSDDLSDMILKQLDDVEKRVKNFGKGVDKIMKSSRKSILIDPPEQKRRRTGGGEFEVDEDGYVQVYTDGACSANGTKAARAGLGVYWGDAHTLNISEPVSGRATNNCGEIQAATCAIKVALQNGVKKLSINTDSQFLINSVTKWMPGWKRKGWKLQSGGAVKNESDFKDLDSVQNQLQIKWNYVEAHRGIHGNEMADQLAKAGAEKYRK